MSIATNRNWQASWLWNRKELERTKTFKETHKSVERQGIVFDQEIIKAREWIPHIGPLTKVIPFKLFLDIVPSSSADITVYIYVVSFRFTSKQRKIYNAVGMSSWTFWLQARELPLSECFNTFRNLNRSLNKRRMSPAQAITTEWTAEKCLDKRKTTNKLSNTS